MNRKSLFWGCAFITLGLALLLYKLNVIDTELHFFTNLWPAFLILAGLAMLKFNELARKVIAGASGVFLGLIVAGLIFSGWHVIRLNVFNFNNEEDDDPSHVVAFLNDTARIEFDSSVRSVDLKLNTSIGEFFVSDSALSLADIIADGNSTKAVKRYSLSGGVADLKLSIDNKSYVFNDNGKSSVPSYIHLSNLPLWNIKARTGAADFKADFSRLRVESFELKGGAASISLKFGDLVDRSEIAIKTGASSVKIYVPKESGCTIKAKTGLSNFSAEQFENVGRNLYRSSNYDSSSKRIDIEFKGGISDFLVERY